MRSMPFGTTCDLPVFAKRSKRGKRNNLRRGKNSVAKKIVRNRLKKLESMGVTDDMETRIRKATRDLEYDYCPNFEYEMQGTQVVSKIRRKKWSQRLNCECEDCGMVSWNDRMRFKSQQHMEFEERLKDDRFSEICSKSIILDQSNRVEMMRISIIREEKFHEEYKIDNPSKCDCKTCWSWKVSNAYNIRRVMQNNLFRKNSGEADQELLLDIQCYEWKFKDWSDQLEMTIRL